MQLIKLEFDGVTCPGCINAIRDKLSKTEKIDLIDISIIDGTSVISTVVGVNTIGNKFQQFKGCCQNCQLTLKSHEVVETSIIQPSNGDDLQLIKKQYKIALERVIEGIEVACSKYCVCKITEVDRFNEFSIAPSFASVYNLNEYIVPYLTAGGSIVDFGSGTGHDALNLAAKHSEV
ncbi:MAG: hypothetical protein IH840_01445, partial [Candidatus Heimdallarchaeota archaeon]|nr:hypothetical protein [Candidatus Heimdallarchaeota archaeon]